MTVSIIIPTFNEAANIGRLVSYLQQHRTAALADIIVSDGGSTDATVEEAARHGAHAVVSPVKGRSGQMNYGASLARGEVLYFVHADTFPPPSYMRDIEKAVEDGYDLGRYRTRFNSKKIILKINAWATRFDFFICMGGDQTLFIKKQLFESSGRFREDMKIMEEYEFCQRARTVGRYRIMKGSALVSARKYDTNSWLTVQRANSKVVSLFRRGASQQEMLETYQHMLNYRKNAF
jgi:rSAM/selenodomain-associated transferase 2